MMAVTTGKLVLALERKEIALLPELELSQSVATDPR